MRTFMCIVILLIVFGMGVNVLDSLMNVDYIASRTVRESIQGAAIFQLCFMAILLLIVMVTFLEDYLITDTVARSKRKRQQEGEQILKQITNHEYYDGPSL